MIFVVGVAVVNVLFFTSPYTYAEKQPLQPYTALYLAYLVGGPPSI